MCLSASAPSRAATFFALIVPEPATADRPAIGLTMFGVTTPCVQAVAKVLEADHDCLVFHATGTGGQAMEKLVDSGLIAGVIDVTTTEVADLLVGGILACSEDRFGAVARTGVPYVGSVGACDMVNFGALETVPERFRGRNLYVHNQQVTLMRTTADECRAIAEFIAAKLNAMRGPVRFLIPEGGVSAIDVPGKPFHDPAADAALFVGPFHGDECGDIEAPQARGNAMQFPANDVGIRQLWKQRADCIQNDAFCAYGANGILNAR